MTDINLDEAPPTTRREILSEARIHLCIVMTHLIPDKVDREHIEKARDLICAALKESS